MLHNWSSIFAPISSILLCTLYSIAQVRRHQSRAAPDLGGAHLERIASSFIQDEFINGRNWYQYLIKFWWFYVSADELCAHQPSVPAAPAVCLWPQVIFYASTQLYWTWRLFVKSLIATGFVNIEAFHCWDIRWRF